MRSLKSQIFRAVLAGIFAASCATQKPAPPQKQEKPKTEQGTKNTSHQQPKKSVKEEAPKPVAVALPPVNREFRAAWVATVANINWPSKGNFHTEAQKREAIQILDALKDANFNAVVFQVRPSADAFFKTNLEPWSYFLTGEIGKAPSPMYDPLEFWIEEAHKRGMELHAWVNPYRAHHSAGGRVTSGSMVNKMPESIYRLKNGMYWMDPSDQKVQDHSAAVIRDLVKRYDLDAIHIDDYFYPYKEYNGGADFPDNRTWNAYRNGGGKLSKTDWRRGNVNGFIKRIHDEIKSEKPYVKFGISPFGIWKPGYPAGIKGSSQYDELFADAKLWLNEGWCDYFAPQLYWKEGGQQSYSALLKWWNDENYRNIHLWPGLNTVGIRGVDKPSEIAGQIRTTRALLQNNAGEIHYNVDGVIKDAAMLSAVKNLYKERALVPVSHWIKVEKLARPNLNVSKNGADFQAKWNSKDSGKIYSWVLYTKYGGTWTYEITDRQISSKTLPAVKNGKPLEIVAITAVDRLGNETENAAVQLKN